MLPDTPLAIVATIAANNLIHKQQKNAWAAALAEMYDHVEQALPNVKLGMMQTDRSTRYYSITLDATTCPCEAKLQEHFEMGQCQHGLCLILSAKPSMHTGWTGSAVIPLALYQIGGLKEMLVKILEMTDIRDISGYINSLQ